MTQNTKILTFLSKGKPLSVDQARASLKVQNLRARVAELRESGVQIKTTKNTKGKLAYALA